MSTADTRPPVAMSLFTLFPGGHGGGETYAKEVARRLAVDERVDARIHLPANAAGWNGGAAEVVEPSVRSAFATVPRLRAILSLLARRRLDDVFGPARVVHYILTLPVPFSGRARKRIVSVADAQHLDLPAMFSRAELLFRSFAYDRAARRADAVVVISEFTKQRLVAHLGLDPDRVHVAHLGVDTAQFSPADVPRERFVLYPARKWPHKNHDRLLEAFALVRKTHPDLRLVLTGASAADFDGLPDYVEARGGVSLDELTDLYRRAAVVAFPSLYEGFGLPPLEAMATGCPVAASNAGSLPEICGDAAVLFDANDAASIAAGILEALARANELSQRGPARAAEFTWERCVTVHVELYRALAGADGTSQSSG